MKKLFVILLFIFSLHILFVSCVKEEKFNTDSNFKLNFSTDTLSFDTVFTTTSSVYKNLMVYNKSDKSVKINRIYIPQGNQSRYRITVDGIAANSVSDVEIKPKDSIYIFIRVNIDPNDQSIPFIVLDSILFDINGNNQKVMLSSFGQNAYYHVPKRFYTIIDENGKEQKIYYSLADDGGTKSGVETTGNTIKWKTDKPHVIIGNCIVDSSKTLEITSGVNLHLGYNALLSVNKDATLRINGTSHSPVAFQGVRLESSYRNIAGQWGGIWLHPGSKNNEINYATISNATVGLRIDSCVNSNPTVKLSNTIIKNCTQYSIAAIGANIEAWNIVLSNCGTNALTLLQGGKYQLRHISIGNFWNESTRTTPSVFISNVMPLVNGTAQSQDIDVYFGNSIIYGGIDTEYKLEQAKTGNFDCLFKNCMIKSSKTLTPETFFENCENLRNNDPKFSDIKNNILKLKPGSPALEKGNTEDSSSPYNIDIEGNFRAHFPTLGAYENTVEQ